MNLGNLECTSLATPECKRKSLIPKALLLATRISECSNVGQSRQVFGTRETCAESRLPVLLLSAIDCRYHPLRLISAIA